MAKTEPLALPSVLDINAAEGLLTLLRAHVKPGERLSLDASSVEILTTPCAQILLVAANTSDVSIENPSVQFATALEDLQITLPLSREAPATAAEPSAAAPETTAAPEPLSAPPAADAPEQLSDPKSSEGAMAKRILTIDDSKTMRDMLMLTLAEAGFDVVQAVDGQDGLDVLVKEKVDVIITDINMPRMDGYEVIRQLRGNPEFQKTPILVLTTESELSKKNLAREVGATGWLVKPFDPDRLVETVRTVAS